MRPDREAGQRLDGEALGASERKGIISLEKEHSAGPKPTVAPCLWKVQSFWPPRAEAARSHLDPRTLLSG